MHILYVEDDPLLRRHVLHELLKSHHDVVEACNGTEACWLLNYHGSDLDLLITDIDLGSELDGWMVAEHARLLSKGIGVIYATGVTADQQPIPNSVTLNKPFSLSTLETAIARAEALRPTVH
jgi:Response regulator containing CheY-like receiver, AAA-type ATPase, and DNA-binding domains